MDARTVDFTPHSSAWTICTAGLPSTESDSVNTNWSANDSEQDGFASESFRLLRSFSVPGNVTTGR